MRELKEMIHAYHEAGISVVMDVVYNHIYQQKMELSKQPFLIITTG